MAIMLFGKTPADLDTYGGGGYTTILGPLISAYQAPGRGIMKSWSMYSASTGPYNVKVKVFRDDGTNYVFIGEGPVQSVSGGLNADMPCWIPVEKGDLIAIYISGTYQIEMTSEVSGSRAYYSGDVTTTIPKSSWTVDSYALALQGKIFTRVRPL